MSAMNFIKTPFPNKHSGFDYEPVSFLDAQREQETERASAENAKQEKKMLSFLANVLD